MPTGETSYGKEPWGTRLNASIDYAKKSLFKSPCTHSEDRTLSIPVVAESVTSPPSPTSVSARTKKVLDFSLFSARDDWKEVAKCKGVEVLYRAAAKGEGVIFGITPELCAVCMEPTIERFPCSGAHPYCVNCRKAVVVPNIEFWPMV